MFHHFCAFVALSLSTCLICTAPKNPPIPSTMRVRLRHDFAHVSQPV